jgi:hypothetical protein
VEQFVAVVPFVFTNIQFASIGNVGVLRLLVSRIDAKQLYELAGQVTLGEVDLFLSVTGVASE